MRIEVTDQSQADLSQLLTLFNRARASAAGLCERHSSLGGFTAMVRGERLLVASIGERMVGFASIWEPERFIHHLYVDPPFQSQGIGSALLDKCRETFGLPLSLKCIEQNRRACRFYEGNGWVVRRRSVGAEGPYLLYMLDDEQPGGARPPDRRP